MDWYWFAKYHGCLTHWPVLQMQFALSTALQVELQIVLQIALRIVLQTALRVVL